MPTNPCFVIAFAAVATLNMSSCSDAAKPAPTPPSAMPGASADGTTAPSVPSASESLKQSPASVKAATGGTDDMKKTLTKSGEDAQMPMVGHGNNHSAPDKNAIDAAKSK